LTQESHVYVYCSLLDFVMDTGGGVNI